MAAPTRLIDRHTTSCLTSGPCHAEPNLLYKGVSDSFLVSTEVQLLRHHVVNL